MRRFFSRWVGGAAIAFGLGILGVSTQAWTSGVSANEGWSYLNAGSLLPGSMLAAPPAAGSAEEQQELRTMHQLQETRTAAECARAKVEADPSFEDFFGPPYGPLSDMEIARLRDFFHRFDRDSRLLVEAEKVFWNRARPYQRDTTLTPCVGLPENVSYPSGHALLAELFADVLSRIDPARSSVFQARAAQIARDRVMGGVHFPSDIRAGEAYGDRVFQLLLQSPAFRTDLKAAIAPGL